MNKCEALAWLVENVKVWPSNLRGGRASIGWSWYYHGKDNDIVFIGDADGNIITKQNWLDAQPHGDSESVFTDTNCDSDIKKLFLGKKIGNLAPKRKIYISGPMTGYADFNRPAFNAAAEKVIADGNAPLNPALAPDGLTQAEYMQLAMQQVFMADAIILLDGWNQSKGARAEYALAEKLGLDIVLDGE